MKGAPRQQALSALASQLGADAASSSDAARVRLAADAVSELSRQ
jgi:hypothetical protein